MRICVLPSTVVPRQCSAFGSPRLPQWDLRTSVSRPEALSPSILQLWKRRSSGANRGLMQQCWERKVLTCTSKCLARHQKLLQTYWTQISHIPTTSPDLLGFGATGWGCSCFLWADHLVWETINQSVIYWEVNNASATTEWETIFSRPWVGELKKGRKGKGWCKRWNWRQSLENSSNLGQQGRETIYQVEGMRRMVELPFSWMMS